MSQNTTARLIKMHSISLPKHSKMASAAFVVWLVLALTGCASNQMIKEYEVKSTYITWVRHSPTVCAGQPETMGCATWTLPRSKDVNACTIMVDFDMPDWVLGHELRHCFGEVHSVKTPSIVLD